MNSSSLGMYSRTIVPTMSIDNPQASQLELFDGTPSIDSKQRTLGYASYRNQAKFRNVLRFF